MLSQQFFDELKSFCKKKMDSFNLPYHNWGHVGQFEKAADLLAIGEKVPAEARENMKIAGFLHEIGMVEGRAGHEVASARIARDFLKGKLSHQRIAKIENLIKATDLERKPQSVVEKIMRDADIAHTGRSVSGFVFFRNDSNVMREEKKLGNFAGTKLDWLKGTEKVLQTGFFTDTAKRFWGKNRQKNFLRLRTKIRRMEHLEKATKPFRALLRRRRK